MTESLRDLVLNVSSQKFGLWLSSKFSHENHCNENRYIILHSLTVWPNGYWPFRSMKSCPNWHIKFAKVGPKFPRIQNKFSKIPQDFQYLVKMAKFCQIWSHCVTNLALSLFLLYSHLLWLRSYYLRIIIVKTWIRFKLVLLTNSYLINKRFT